jgi:membrane-anchored protein YejM (alkaline phosphatase superfamily)
VRQRLRFCGWFAGANILVFLAISLIYFRSTLPINFITVSPLGQILTWLFIALTYLGHFSLLAFISWLLLTPLCLLPQRLCLPLAILVMTFATVLLVVDAKLYTFFHSHFSKIFYDLIVNPEAQNFFILAGWEYVYIASLLAGLLLFETLIALGLWHFWLKAPAHAFAKPASLFLCSCLGFSYLIYGVSLPITPKLALHAGVLPLYNNILGKLLTLMSMPLNLDTIGFSHIPSIPRHTGNLAYPLEPLQVNPPKKPRNIVLIIIDSWRFNSLTPEIMPHTAHFAESALNFKTHMAAANATGPGIFNLFYSLPYTYWSAMEANKQGPLFIKTLQQQNYTFRVISSAQLILPAFDKTVFIDIPNLPKTVSLLKPVDRNRKLTKEALNFLNSPKQTSPYFALFYYDMAQAYCADYDFPTPFKPIQEPCNRINPSDSVDPIPYLNRYLNALHFIDSELQQVYASLEKNRQLENTVVIITGDHGQEFNDSHRNTWEHARTFTRYQVQTPLIIRWPGIKAQTITAETSHYDLVPTLMRHLLGVTNPIADYSIGQDLFNRHPQDFLFVSGYIYPGWVQKNQIATWYQSGRVEITDLEGNPQPDAEVSSQQIKEILKLSTQYYR